MAAYIPGLDVDPLVTGDTTALEYAVISLLGHGSKRLTNLSTSALPFTILFVIFSGLVELRRPLSTYGGQFGSLVRPSRSVPQHDLQKFTSKLL
jgi:hypothetical protein